MEGNWGHQPVLLEEVLEYLAPQGKRVLVDCTVGLGGHAEAMLAAAGDEATLIGMDADESNLRLAKDRLAGYGPRVRLFWANFSELDEVLRQADVPQVDVLLADLGVASTQIDQPQRGMSFSVDGPLDMRMDSRLERTAADLVNEMEEGELADLIFAYGEERFSRRIAHAIVETRKQKRLERTLELANLVSRAYPAAVRHARRGVHPATRTFQALRIAVNDELGSLDRLLALVPKVLSIGGRAAIISFHSLEDRRVKQAFAGWAATGRAHVLTRKVITPRETESAGNPRSRSAKLRAIERVS